jgi:hypothetical protein
MAMKKSGRTAKPLRKQLDALVRRAKKRMPREVRRAVSEFDRVDALLTHLAQVESAMRPQYTSTATASTA